MIIMRAKYPSVDVHLTRVSGVLITVGIICEISRMNDIQLKRLSAKTCQTVLHLTAHTGL